MQLSSIIEALLTASETPLPTSELARIIRKSAAETAEENLAEGQAESSSESTPPSTETSLLPHLEALQKIQDDDVLQAIEALNNAYLETDRSFTILERAKGWKIYTTPAYADFIRQLYPDQKPRRLSAPAMETLAVVAYRQPITKAAIEAIRGVSCDGMLQKLLDQELVHIQGRADLPGRPLLYETTELFFEHFGVKSVQDLPNSQELRTVPLPEAKEKEGEKENSTGDDQDLEKEPEEPSDQNASEKQLSLAQALNAEQ